MEILDLLKEESFSVASNGTATEAALSVLRWSGQEVGVAWVWSK